MIDVPPDSVEPLPIHAIYSGKAQIEGVAQPVDIELDTRLEELEGLR